MKPVGQGVLELRLTYGPGYRVYYAQQGDRLVLLLCGGDKSTQHQGHPEGTPTRRRLALAGGRP